VRADRELVGLQTIGHVEKPRHRDCHGSLLSARHPVRDRVSNP
jgi:hypothetical protein